MKKFSIILLISAILVLDGCSSWQSYKRNDSLTTKQHGAVSYVKGGRAFCHSK